MDGLDFHMQSSKYGGKLDKNCRKSEEYLLRLQPPWHPFFLNYWGTTIHNTHHHSCMWFFFWQKLWTSPVGKVLGYKSPDRNSIQTFCPPEPRPTTPSVLVDISSYSYQLGYIQTGSLSVMIKFLFFQPVLQLFWPSPWLLHYF